MPKAWGHQRGGTTHSSPLEAGQAPGCRPGSDRRSCSSPRLPRAGAPLGPGLALLPLKGTHTESQSYPHSRALGSPGSSCSSGDLWGAVKPGLYTVSPNLLSRFTFFHKYLVFPGLRSGTTLRIYSLGPGALTHHLGLPLSAPCTPHQPLLILSDGVPGGQAKPVTALPWA